MTIEERVIKKHCIRCGARTLYNCSPDKTPCSYVKDYINIATEQKSIDIEVAVAWLRKYVRPYYKFSIKDFKKAMEE